MPSRRNLSVQQLKFALALSEGKTQREAYVNAYPASKDWKPANIDRAAQRLANNQLVKARVSQVAEKAADDAGASVAVVLRETMRIAMSDVSKIIGPGNKVLLPNELDPDTKRAVASFKIDEYGRIEYKFWDKNAALEKLFKHLGMFAKDNDQKPPPVIREIRLVPLQALPKASPG